MKNSRIFFSPISLTGANNILNIDKSATKEDIRKAYRKAALAHHPDKVSPEEREGAEVRFKAVNQAYDILYDDEKRHIYDTHGMSAFDGSGRAGMQGGPDLDDLLASMFGGGMNMGGGMPGFGGPRPSKPRKGQNEVQEYSVSLEDLYKGRTVKFSSTKNVLCSLCKGKGGKEKATPKLCSTCGGAGYRETLVQVGPGMVSRAMAECKVCEGSGSFFQPKDKCKKCKGKQVTEERKLLEVYIPRGAKQGDKIILEGEGDQLPNTEPGDIIFHLEEIEHETFRRAGADLMADIEVTLAEALCGFSRVVLKHLDGRGIEITHPKTEGSVLRPNQILKVAGEGMPFKKSDARGDLYLAVQIKFPDDGWASDPTALTKLREILPRPGPTIKAETVDDVEYDPKASLGEFGSKDTQGNSSWEDEDEEDGGQTQCTTQ
ncbi:mitochondrial import protein MAS5 [Histoplasma capsulatum G186AR]|uniref:Mitochondrial import protein MAS5 n=1 Tax=Ajellomyces capsulatus (strain G186AR / H82 / ATCC MYA-2454 / RMSCC 2432) TaxID=447093 RepID=C0NWL8_AJECG|nr:mitochondrial import protein MAS5 [Histoplasma capsulatum G186AR]EEH04323.1 mitochondrial import protein MAS5 [Histoplasma capsulatum G186AR]